LNLLRTPEKKRSVYARQPTSAPTVLTRHTLEHPISQDESQNPVKRNSFFRKLYKNTSTKADTETEAVNESDDELKIIHEDLGHKIKIKDEPNDSDSEFDSQLHSSQKSHTSRLDSDKSYDEKAQCRQRHLEEKRHRYTQDRERELETEQDAHWDNQDWEEEQETEQDAAFSKTKQRNSNEKHKLI
jgi:hypothetical protein